MLEILPQTTGKHSTQLYNVPYIPIPVSIIFKLKSEPQYSNQLSPFEYLVPKKAAPQSPMSPEGRVLRSGKLVLYIQEGDRLAR